MSRFDSSCNYVLGTNRGPQATGVTIAHFLNSISINGSFALVGVAHETCICSILQTYEGGVYIEQISFYPCQEQKG